MKTVYVSNSGNDRNDGFSPNNAVHSWKRALKRQGGDNTIDIHVTGEAAKRITKEIVKRALAMLLLRRRKQTSDDYGQLRS